MKTLKENASGIVMCLFELVVGILLLVNPIGFTSGIITAFGIVLAIVGLGSCIKYFRAEPAEAAKSQLLAKGLIALLAGCFCVFRSEWFVVTFPVLTLIYGVVILITGLAKVQWMVDILRLKKQKWFLAAISAVISIICGAVIISSPFNSTAVLWMFTGISLIAEAVFDVVALLLGSGKKDAAQEAADTENEAEEV